MHSSFRIKQKKYWITFLTASVIVLVNIFCLGYTPLGHPSTTPASRGNFAGSQACINCHRDIYNTHIKTAHFRTSAPASAKSIKGSFNNRENTFRYNKFMEMKMEQKGDRFFQVANVNGMEYHREEFSLVIGSGRKGQTYLYWKDSSLFELPVSYYVPTQSWCNSPGFPASMITFDRQVGSRCLECHSTFARTEEFDEGNTLFDSSALVLGIDCERCHGPAGDHVTFHESHPQEKQGQFIIGFGKLTRQQKVDACALCHSGFRKSLQPAFTFMPGDKLDDFSKPDYNADSAFSLDVHGNQFGLLSSSKCYISSNNMDCSSCHNVHRDESRDLALFSSRCVNCHNGASQKSCPQPDVQKLSLQDNCIDCHMPLSPSGKILLELSDTHQSSADLVRTHRIAVYPGQSSAFLNKLHHK